MPVGPRARVENPRRGVLQHLPKRGIAEGPPGDLHVIPVAQHHNLSKEPVRLPQGNRRRLPPDQPFRDAAQRTALICERAPSLCGVSDQIHRTKRVWRQTRVDNAVVLERDPAPQEVLQPALSTPPGIPQHEIRASKQTRTLQCPNPCPFSGTGVLPVPPAQIKGLASSLEDLFAAHWPVDSTGVLQDRRDTCPTLLAPSCRLGSTGGMRLSHLHRRRVPWPRQGRALQSRAWRATRCG
jgi:hypothetical protein